LLAIWYCHKTLAVESDLRCSGAAYAKRQHRPSLNQMGFTLSRRAAAGRHRDEDKVSEGSRRTKGDGVATSSSDPIAQIVAALVSTKQLSLIRKLAEGLTLDPEAICQELYRARLDEISRKAASALIDRLNAMSPQNGNHNANHQRRDRKQNWRY
jgi:hypothetical protein